MSPLFTFGDIYPGRACRIEGWTDGWSETRDPCVHGHGNSNIRRFFWNDALGCGLWTEETLPLTIFDGGITLRACIDYRDPRTGMYCMIKGDGVVYDKTSLVFGDVESIPSDPVLEALFGGTETKDLLFDMYGTACILAMVEDEAHAFRVAKAIAERAKG